MSSKGKQLMALATRVPVPKFVVLQLGDTYQVQLGARVIVRGCYAEEDGSSCSHAGQSPSVGPVAPGEVQSVLTVLFKDRRVVECIVQEWIDGPSGVALSLPDGGWLVEYAREPQAVTAGRGSPFCAILPNHFQRYGTLERELSRVSAEFGACDVEFVGLQSPQFVQVRPLTAPIVVDRGLVCVKQVLQELEESEWEQDSFCTDLMERPEQDGAWIDLYLAMAPSVYERATGVRPELGVQPFLKIGRQIYRSAQMARALRLSPMQALRVGWRSAGVLPRLSLVIEDPSCPPEDLMAASIELNLHADLPTARWGGRARELFTCREKCRKRLAESLPQRRREVDIPAAGRLNRRLLLDHRHMTWQSFGWLQGNGVRVVGELPEGARLQVYTRNPTQVRLGVLLYTEELFPELAEVLSRVAGIVCAGGGVNSHLAILCREAGVPLQIQVGDDWLSAHGAQR